MVHAFRDGQNYIVLDVESGAVHLMDELAFELVRIRESAEQNDAAGENVTAGLALRFGEPAVRETIGELSQLERSGELFTPEKPFVPLAGGSVVKALCLHVAHDCNLRCAYCFASQGEYRSGRALMPLSVGKQALDFLIEKSADRKHLEVDFFGGEPLLNLGVVKALVAYGRDLEKCHGKQINFTITTNCLNIDDDFIDFCDKEIFNIVLSLDGREQVHNAVRKTQNGKGSFAQILPKARKMALARQEKGQSYYVRGTFTHENLDFVQDVLYLADQGFEQISIEPVVLPDDHQLALCEADLPRIEKEYETLAKEYVARRAKDETWFNFFHFMIDLDGGPCLAKRMGGCGAGSEYVAITPQGDIYPCHQFVGNEEYRMGSVITGEWNAHLQKTFRAGSIVTKEECRACWARYYCSGGCAANAFQFNGDIRKPHAASCRMQKKRLEVAIGVYVRELLAKNRLPGGLAG